MWNVTDTRDPRDAEPIAYNDKSRHRSVAAGRNSGCNQGNCAAFHVGHHRRWESVSPKGGSGRLTRQGRSHWGRSHRSVAHSIARVVTRRIGRGDRPGSHSMAPSGCGSARMRYHCARNSGTRRGGRTTAEGNRSLHRHAEPESAVRSGRVRDRALRRSVGAPTSRRPTHSLRHRERKPSRFRHNARRHAAARAGSPRG